MSMSKEGEDILTSQPVGPGANPGGSQDGPPKDLASRVEERYDRYGQRKPMGIPSELRHLPHYFLLRTFLGQNDLLVILNTKRCRYQCAFCTLPAKSSRAWIPDADVLEQFDHVTHELRHALSVIDRVTLSNEGSMLDQATIGRSAVDGIVAAIGKMRRVRRIELETRLEFVDPDRVRDLRRMAPRVSIGILTGFETVNEQIREQHLRKRESLVEFLTGLDRVAEAGAALTAYVLFKPDPAMADDDAVLEAKASPAFLSEECERRDLQLTVRLNPMYLAVGSRWARSVEARADYSPPRLTDVMRVAEEGVANGVPIYIGLSTEGLAGKHGTYIERDDYSPRLVRYIKQFNDGSLSRFPWDEIASLPANQADV